MLLKAQNRELLGKKVSSLRKVNSIPAAAYGSAEKSVSLVIDEKELISAIKAVGHSALFDLEIEGQAARKALFKEIQFDYLKNKILHVSIFFVDMKKPITTTIPVRITGLSMAVKNNLGLLVNPISIVSVHCLPDDLPTEVVVDISGFNELGDSVTLGDLKFPEGVALASGQSADNIVAAIVTPQKAIEEEVKEVTPEEGEEGAETAEGETEEGKKPEGEGKPEGKTEEKTK
jgi:large subunit ribosomal protein L25